MKKMEQRINHDDMARHAANDRKAQAMQEGFQSNQFRQASGF